MYLTSNGNVVVIRGFKTIKKKQIKFVEAAGTITVTPYRGQGFGGIILKAFENFVLDKLNLYWVVLEPLNSASYFWVQKQGFKWEIENSKWLLKDLTESKALALASETYNLKTKTKDYILKSKNYRNTVRKEKFELRKLISTKRTFDKNTKQSLKAIYEGLPYLFKQKYANYLLNIDEKYHVGTWTNFELVLLNVLYNDVKHEILPVEWEKYVKKLTLLAYKEWEIVERAHDLPKTSIILIFEKNEMVLLGSCVFTKIPSIAILIHEVLMSKRIDFYSLWGVLLTYIKSAFKPKVDFLIIDEYSAFGDEYKDDLKKEFSFSDLTPENDLWEHVKNKPLTSRKTVYKEFEKSFFDFTSK